MSQVTANRAGRLEIVAIAINNLAAFHPPRTITKKNHYSMNCRSFKPFAGLARLWSGA